MSKKEEDKIIDAFSISKNSVVVTDTHIYEIELFTGDFDDFEEELRDDVAYINGDYFYIYRGKLKKDFRGELKPGIYKNYNDEPKYIIVDPRTDQEKEEFDIREHVVMLNPKSIVDIANAKEEILVAIPESTKIFQPILSSTDDILKRITKLALIEKNVDLDRYKDKFSDKNCLFNFKQVLKGNNKVSILIFNRGCDALNLKYTITIEEKDDVNYVGTKLEKPIVVSSEDTYEI